MKTIKDILSTLNEADSQEEEGLVELLEDVRELYAEETGDTSFKNYDVGLQILESVADQLSEDAQDVIGAQLYETFFADEEGEDEEGEDEEGEEDMEESMKVVKKVKKTAAEKMKAHKEYTADKSKLKARNKKWRKSAAGKKWADRYRKFKDTHKTKKGQRIKTV